MPKLRLPDGVEVRTFTPAPAGFDPRKADPAALALHGIPPRPVGNPAYLAKWESVVGRVTRYFEPTFRDANRRLGRPDAPRPGLRDAATVPLSGSGLAGGDMAATAGAQMTFVSGEFTLPTQTQNFQGEGYGCLFAVSLDRYTPFPLVAGVYLAQAGDGSQFGGTPVSQSLQAFWAFGYQQLLRVIEINGAPYPLNPGDTVKFMMSVQNPSAVSEVNIYFDGPAGATSFAGGVPQGVAFTGQDASWTVEPMDTVPSFGTVYFSDALAGQSCDAGGSGLLIYAPDTSNTKKYQLTNCTAQVAGGEVVCTAS